MFSLQVKLPVIEAAVDNGVVHSGAHCKPHDSQVDLLNEGMLKQMRVEQVNQEIDVIGEPANSKRTYHHNHHLHHLRVGKKRTFQYWLYCMAINTCSVLQADFLDFACYPHCTKTGRRLTDEMFLNHFLDSF